MLRTDMKTRLTNGRILATTGTQVPVAPTKRWRSQIADLD